MQRHLSVLRKPSGPFRTRPNALPSAQVLQSDWEVEGFAGDDECGFYAYTLDGPQSAAGLMAYTWDAATMGAFITEQTEACFYENSPFSYFHCTLPVGGLLFVGSDNAA